MDDTVWYTAARQSDDTVLYTATPQRDDIEWHTATPQRDDTVWHTVSPQGITPQPLHLPHYITVYTFYSLQTITPVLPERHFLLHHMCNRNANKRHRAAVALSGCNAPVSVTASEVAAIHRMQHSHSLLHLRSNTLMKPKWWLSLQDSDQSAASRSCEGEVSEQP